jgi:hypothetical protein
MNSKVAIAVVLALFVPFTIWCALTGGTLAEILAAFGANPWTMQVSGDLVLALSLVCAWIWQDARSRGANPIPWLVATACTGSIAPLVYLLLRPGDSQ